MDTLIGNFNLTENQVENMVTLAVTPFKGFSFHSSDGSVIGVSDTSPSQQQVSDAVSAVNSLPDILDKKALESKFDIDMMLGAMGLTFTGLDAVSLAPYLSAIQNAASVPFRNFKLIKDFIGGLVATSKATQQQADSLYQIFLQQGIDLASY